MPTLKGSRFPKAVTLDRDRAAERRRKARFWKKHVNQRFNERQRAMIDRLFEAFEGKLNTSK